jgi:predicted RNase H-like HicB family nuclease
MMRLRWGWQGPTEVREPNEDPFFEIRIRELPDFFVAGKTREEVLVASAPALRAFLESYTDAGEMPPLPEDRQLSWIVRNVVVAAPRSLPKVRDPNESLFTQ